VLRSRLIAIANKAYPDGMIAQVYEAINDGVNPDTVGDTLATFIVQELIGTFDPEASDIDQLREAIRVMQTACRELTCVHDALVRAFNAQPSDAERRRTIEKYEQGQ